MPHELTINNFIIPPSLCNQTVMEIVKDKGWHRESEHDMGLDLKVMQSALQTLKHYQEGVWYKQGCDNAGVGTCSWRAPHACKKASIPGKELRKALRIYGEYVLASNRWGALSSNLDPSSFDCWTSERNAFGTADTGREIQKRENLEYWIKQAIIDMEPVVKNYEKDLDMLESIDASCLSPRPPFWKTLLLLSLVGTPLLGLAVGVYHFRDRFVCWRKVDENGSRELQPLK